MTHCSQKKTNKQKQTNKHSQVFLVFRKNPNKWNYGWGSVLKTCTTLTVGIFERICSFDEVFLMALTSTEQLFTERPLHRRFLHNCHLPYFNVIGFIIFHLSVAATGGVLSQKVVLEILQNSQENTCGKISF